MPLKTSVDPLNSYKSKAEWLRTFFFGGGVRKFSRPPPSNPGSPSETNIFISQSIHRVKIHLNRLVQTIRMTGNTIQGLDIVLDIIRFIEPYCDNVTIYSYRLVETI